jgi:voltage-gated potassium channel
VIFKTLKEIHLREIANVSIVGIKEKDGQFRAMPKGNAQLLIGSSLLIIGTSEGIAKTKKLLKRTTKPEELKYV